jgi:hypothetical protein
MKYLGLIFIAFLFVGCDRSQGDIEFTGTVNGISTVVIRDQSNNNLYTADIQSGKLTISKRFLKSSGYYKLMYAGTSGSTRNVEIYLEPGSYTLNIDINKINNYPSITSTSKIQTQLSAYNALADSLTAEGRKKVVSLNSKLNNLKDTVLRPGEYTTMVDKFQTEELKANQFDGLNVLKTFISRYPDNEIAAHIMLKMDYQDDPAAHAKVFETFSSAAKSSDEGKELEGKLKQLSKLAPGSAPAIAGNTADGKTFDIKSLNKKIILLDIWRSSNGTSRDNHLHIQNDILQMYGNKGLGVVSISFDTEKDKWLAAIDHDNMKWPQVSDLKGDDSPNADAWGVKSIPTYYLLDGQGRIIERITAFSDVRTALDDYFTKHH